MEVNFFGTVRCTKAFLPLIRSSQGRIVNMGSIGAHSPSAFGSSYLSTKSAMVSYSQCVRQEVHRFGVRVSLVEPGFFRTELLSSGGANGATGAKDQGEEEKLGDYPRYQDKMKATEKAIQASEFLNDVLSGGVPGVVDCVLDALCNPHPLSRYIVGVDAYILRFVVAYLPAWVVDWAQTLA